MRQEGISASVLIYVARYVCADLGEYGLYECMRMCMHVHVNVHVSEDAYGYENACLHVSVEACIHTPTTASS